MDDLIFFLIILLVIGILLREFWTWFLKINDMVNKQTKIIDQQDELIKEQQETNRILKLWARAEASRHKGES